MESFEERKERIRREQEMSDIEKRLDDIAKYELEVEKSTGYMRWWYTRPPKKTFIGMFLHLMIYPAIALLWMPMVFIPLLIWLFQTYG